MPAHQLSSVVMSERPIVARLTQQGQISEIAIFQQLSGMERPDAQLSSPLPVTTKCGSSADGLNIRQCSSLEESSGKTSKAYSSSKQIVKLPASPTSTCRTKNCRVSFWNSSAMRLSRQLDPLHVPVEIFYWNSALCSGIVEITTTNDHVISLPDPPTTLNMKGVFTDFLHAPT